MQSVTGHNVRLMAKYANDAENSHQIANVNNPKMANNGGTIDLHLNLKNKFFKKDDFVYIENTIYNVSSTNFYANTNASFLNIEKVNVASISDNNSSSVGSNNILSARIDADGTILNQSFEWIDEVVPVIMQIYLKLTMYLHISIAFLLLLLLLMLKMVYHT